MAFVVREVLLLFAANDVRGRSVSSSSLNSGEGGSSSSVKERWETLWEGRRVCLVCLIGEDSARPEAFFQVGCLLAAVRVRLPVWAVVMGMLGGARIGGGFIAVRMRFGR